MNEEYAVAWSSGECDDEQLPTTIPNLMGINRYNSERENGRDMIVRIQIMVDKVRPLTIMEPTKILVTKIQKKNTPHLVQKKNVIVK